MIRNNLKNFISSTWVPAFPLHLVVVLQFFPQTSLVPLLCLHTLSSAKLARRKEVVEGWRQYGTTLGCWFKKCPQQRRKNFHLIHCLLLRYPPFIASLGPVPTLCNRVVIFLSRYTVRWGMVALYSLMIMIVCLHIENNIDR